MQEVLQNAGKVFVKSVKFYAKLLPKGDGYDTIR